MGNTGDIVIIGGGVMGASIAFHLAKQGETHVTLLERHALCNGTTARSGAIVRQHYSNDFTIRMARDSLRIFEHFEDIVGGDGGFVTTGMLVLAGPEHAGALEANVTLQQSLGVQTSILAPSEVSEVAPGYNTHGYVAACYEPEAGVADPMATTQAFARRAAELGATINEGVTVTALLTDDSHITGVRTSIGDIAAGIVIVAANVWSPALLAPLGLDLPITATRHPMVAMRRADGVQERAAKHAVCLDMARGIYLRPEVGGITLVGSTENVLTPENPDHYAQGLTEDEIAFFRTQGANCYSPLAQAAPRGGWAGLYDDTPDYHPVLDQLPGYSGLYVAAGFSGHGFKLSPIVGQWMADLVLNGHKHPDMQPMNFARFANGQEILPSYASGVLA